MTLRKGQGPSHPWPLWPFPGRAHSGFLVFTIPLPDKCHGAPTCSLFLIQRIPVVIWCLKLRIPNQSFSLVYAVKETDGEKPREEKANKRQPSPSQHSRRDILAHMDAPMTFKWDQSFASGVTCPEHLVIHVVTQERLLRLSSAPPLSPPLLGPFLCQWCVPSSGRSTWPA